MTKFRNLILVLMFVIATFGSGCYHFHHTSGTVQKRVDMKPSSSATTKDFKVKKGWISMWLWGLVGADIEVDKLIEREIGPNKDISSLKIDTKQSFLNGLVNIVTLGIYTPQSIEIAGSYQTSAPSPQTAPTE